MISTSLRVLWWATALLHCENRLHRLYMCTIQRLLFIFSMNAKHFLIGWGRGVGGNIMLSTSSSQILLTLLRNCGVFSERSVLRAWPPVFCKQQGNHLAQVPEAVVLVPNTSNSSLQMHQSGMVSESLEFNCYALLLMHLYNREISLAINVAERGTPLA